MLLHEYARAWGVVIEEQLETPTSSIAFGMRGGTRVVLKVGIERHAGEVLAAFGGHGTARVYEHAPDAVLLERLDPGTPLSERPDGEAVDVLVDVIARMTQVDPPCAGVPTVEEWGVALAPVAEARQTYAELCATQKRRRLLHGDLHPGNVLFDARRGWLAIDAKGVVGELEYEMGAALRNLAEPAVVRERIARFASALRLDPERIRRWAFAQAVLSVLWSIEDGEAVSKRDPRLLLADVLRQGPS